MAPYSYPSAEAEFPLLALALHRRPPAAVVAPVQHGELRQDDPRRERDEVPLPRGRVYSICIQRVFKWHYCTFAKVSRIRRWRCSALGGAAVQPPLAKVRETFAKISGAAPLQCSGARVTGSTSFTSRAVTVFAPRFLTPRFFDPRLFDPPLF